MNRVVIQSEADMSESSGVMSAKTGAQKVKFVAVAVFAIAAMLVSVRAVSGPQDKPTPQAAAPANSTPTPAPAAEKPPQVSPEMEKLSFYLGEWDYVEKYEKGSMYPNGAEDTGVYTSTSGPGRNSVVQHFHSKGSAGEFEGMIVMTWDPREKQYKGYTFAGDFPGGIVQNGQFENGVLVFRSEFSMGSTKISYRNTAKLIAPGKLEGAGYTSTNGGGPEKLFMKVEATKR
jgi:hypothetical protein